ncbi:LysR family transcriptional regulator [Pseudomonadota bacterium]
MEIKQLRYFLTVAEEGNLTKASRKLHTVQSNTTSKIKKLEDELGHELFIRSKRGMELTNKGVTLVHYAKQILDAETNITRLMDNETDPVGVLSIACLDTFIRIYLHNIIPRFVKAFPNVEFELQTAFNNELIQMLEDGTADMVGVVGSKEFSNYETVFKRKEKIVLLSKTPNYSEHPLLILGKECFFGQTLLKQFSKNKILKIASVESILTSVSSGIGITLLPESLVRSGNNEDLIKQTINQDCEYYLIRKKRRPWSSSEKEFSKMLCSS